MRMFIRRSICKNAKKYAPTDKFVITMLESLQAKRREKLFLEAIHHEQVIWN